MARIQPWTLAKTALLPTALLLMAAAGSQVALASQPAATANVPAGGVSAPASDSYYTMKLSSPSATVSSRHLARIAISFRAPADLHGTPVALSVTGLPSGVTAQFSPPTTVIGGHAILTLSAAPSSAGGTFAVSVIAMSQSSDPIGTSTTLDLTVTAP